MTIIAIHEKHNSQLDSSSLPFYVRDDTSAYLSEAMAVTTAQAAATLSQGSPGEGYRYKRLSVSVARVQILYRAGAVTVYTQPETGSASYTFNFRATPRHPIHSLNSVRRVPSDAVDFKGALNFKPVGYGLMVPQGIAVPVPTVTDRISYQFPNPVISAAYRNALRDLFDEGGAVSSTPFLGQPRGSMRLVECTSTVRSTGDQTINFGFAYLKNKVRIPGGLNIGEVNGHDVYWTMDRPLISAGPDAKDVLVSETFAGYVEEVLPYFDFAVLGLPAI